MKGLMLSCQIESIASRKDKTVKVVIGTQELSPSKAGELFNLNNKIATVYISEKAIDQREMDQIDKIDPEFEGKTQSQRIRNVLYILYTQADEGFHEFETYYRNKTDKIIDHLKGKIIP